MSDKVVTEWLPQDIDDLSVVFPTDVSHLMPKYEDIPDDFKGMGRGDARKWVDFQSDWFFGGLEDAESYPEKGIDPAKAWRHLKAIQGSWEPKHEHKAAAVAYLAALWFKDIKYKRAKS